MGAEAMSGRSSPRQPGSGGRTKSGKPRGGTGGYGKRKLEGKGPTPPASMRPGHPAQRRASAQARAAARPAGRADDRRADDRRTDDRRADSRPARGYGGPVAVRGAGSAAEIIAGRNAVLEALRE